LQRFFRKGGNFNPEESLVDPYPLLPGIWHDIEPDEKKISNIIEEHNGSTVNCILKLRDKCNLRVSDMNNIILSYEVATEHPGHLEMGQPTNKEHACFEINTELETAKQSEFLMLR